MHTALATFLSALMGRVLGDMDISFLFHLRVKFRTRLPK